MKDEKQETNATSSFILHPSSFLKRRNFSLSPRPILFVVTAIVLLYGVVYPNLYVVAASLQRSGSWTLANYRDALGQRIVLEAIANSVGLSVATVLLCPGGVPLAFLFERYTFPDDSYCRLAALPLVCHRSSARSPLSFFAAGQNSRPRRFSFFVCKLP